MILILQKKIMLKAFKRRCFAQFPMLAWQPLFDLIKTVSFVEGGVAVLTMHHQGEFFLSSGLKDNKITIWDAETMLDIQSFETPKVF